MMPFRQQARWPKMMSPGAYVIKLFTAVIYHHSTVIPSFCVIKLYYLRKSRVRITLVIYRCIVL
jgi:hypothetical protein